MHTPGPWTVIFGSRGGAVRIEGPKDNRPGAVGSVVRQNGIGMPACSVGKANARLISAAPELIGIIVRFWDASARCFRATTDADAHEINAAIAKAEGK